METIKGKIAVKARNKKGFKIEGDDNWFTAKDPVIPYLEKIEKGDEVEITFSKNGVFRNVTKIVKTETTKTEEKSAPAKSTEKPKTGFNCADCGKELPNDKYKKCYDCNKKSPVKGKNDKSKDSYNNPERTANIQRGNAINAAGYAVSGNLTGSDPSTIKEAVLLLANAFLDWIRAE